mmetsp:Transcript_13072/g.22054  ORF Transcript_13072/g.22054 Transcript_13072/m.22054 type:complete len:152 (-) Transcript_13072:23-478(-)
MGNSLKGVAIIFDLQEKDVQQAFDLGVQLGNFYQFAIFSHIMTAIIDKGEKQAVKEHLSRLSNMLQYLSFEFVENMLYKMKTLNLKGLHHEFLFLTEFHFQEVQEQLNALDLDSETKNNLLSSISQFRADLFDLAKFDPSTSECHLDLSKK